jgi:ribokinase
MKTARQKGVETIINPAPAIPLPGEAYQGLGHLIVNETEAAILSGIENPTNWNGLHRSWCKKCHHHAWQRGELARTSDFMVVLT